jgi:hypothetical protein
LHPGKLLGRAISLDESVTALASMDRDASLGVKVITSF